MVTNELLIKKIKEQINDAENVMTDPILFKEAIKRVELLCELVTDNNSEQKNIPKKITPEILKHDIPNSNKQVSPETSSDSIFDF